MPSRFTEEEELLKGGVLKFLEESESKYEVVHSDRLTKHPDIVFQLKLMSASISIQMNVNI